MSLDTAAAGAAVSWLRLPEPAPGTSETEQILAATQQKAGYIRNQQRVLAHKPAILSAISALGDAVVRDETGILSPRERELIALVVSAENRCEPCVFGHAAALRGHTGEPEWVATIEVNYRRAALPPRERALSDYALKLTRSPAEVEPSDLQALRDVGVPELGILEAAAVAAYFNLSNRLNSGLGVRANAEAYRANR
jgi:uncharacterized peroxidase-related enzyme